MTAGLSGIWASVTAWVQDLYAVVMPWFEALGRLIRSGDPLIILLLFISLLLLLILMLQLCAWHRESVLEHRLERLGGSTKNALAAWQRRNELEISRLESQYVENPAAGVLVAASSGQTEAGEASAPGAAYGGDSGKGNGDEPKPAGAAAAAALATAGMAAAAFSSGNEEPAPAAAAETRSEEPAPAGDESIGAFSAADDEGAEPVIPAAPSESDGSSEPFSAADDENAAPVV